MNMARLERDGYRDLEIWGELLQHAAPQTSEWSAPTRSEEFRFELGAMIGTKEHGFHFDCDPAELGEVQDLFQKALRAEVFGAGFLIDPAGLDDTPAGFAYSGVNVSGEIRLTLRNTPIDTRHRLSIEMVERYF